MNSSSQLAICFSHLDEIARRARRAVELAGGVAFQVRTAAPSDFVTSAGHRGGYILSARARAVRARVDEPTAAAMGVRTPRRRLELFVLGSVFAALGGAVYAGTQLFVPATPVSPTAELALLMMLFVGGRRSVLGAVAGVVAIQYLSGASHWVSVNILIVDGVLLTVVLLVDPDGLVGIVAPLAARLRPHPRPALPLAAPHRRPTVAPTLAPPCPSPPRPPAPRHTGTVFPVCLPSPALARGRTATM